MYTGKHLPKDRKTGYLRTFFLWALILTMALGAAGFVYAKILEASIHEKAGNEGDGRFKQPKANEPVTFLVLGSDTRGGDDRGRSDTIMIFRMNPKKKIAYLISIPRDTRVKIPGHGKTKINAAYQYGGAPLMAETIEQFSGLRPNHYVIVDFQGFKEIVDAIGGIDIYVEKKIRDHFEGQYVKIDAGMNHFNGDEALKYVRVRKVDDDFGRMKRQQKFIKAVMEKLTRLSNVFRIPRLASIAARNLRTDPNLGITQMVAYGQALRSIGRENVHMASIPATPQTIDGISFVIPDEEKTAWIFNRIKEDKPLELTAEEKENENIKIAVRNGSGKPGLARKLAAKLAALSFKIDEIGNAQRYDYGQTQIITSKEKEEYAKRVKSQLGFGEIVTEGYSSIPSDVLIIVGRDFAEISSSD
ncbi:MAG: LCP family protein [Actinomycetota bacterium]|nr:LCP family protein [Actinomycetota bacterium]